MSTRKSDVLIPPNWRELTTLDVPVAGAIVGLGKVASYQAVRRGDLPAERFGGRWRVPVARLIRKLEG